VQYENKENMEEDECKKDLSRRRKKLVHSEHIYNIWTEELTHTNMRMKNRKKMAVFSVAAPCNLVEICQRFRGRFCLHHQGDDSSS
jgi:hypothetical protein